MSTNLLTNVYWSYGTDPDIRFDLSYESKRTGTDMQYKFFWRFHSLNTPQSGFGWPIYTTVVLNGIAKISGVTIKGTSPMKWFDSNTVVYESDWLTVSDCMDGTVSWSMSLFSGMGMSRFQKWTGSLAVLPAATVPDASSITFGSSFTIYTPAAVEGYTHSVKVSLDSNHELEANLVESYVSFTLPMEWLNYYTSGVSAPLTVSCRTYDDGVLVGSEVERTFYASVPSSVVPSVTVTASAVSGFYGQFLAGRSKCRVISSAAGAYYSTISSISVTVGDKSGTGSDWTSEVLTTPGEYGWKVTIRDSRGREASANGTITVLSYSGPTIAGSQMVRCLSSGVDSESGTYAHINVSCTYSSNVSGNSLQIKTSYCRRPGYTYTQSDTFDAAVYNGPACSGSLLLNGSYYVKVTAIDSVGLSASFIGTVPSSSNYGMTINGRKAAFGRYVDIEKTDGLQVYGDLHVSGGINIGTALPVSMGGTGANNAADARQALGIVSSATKLLERTLSNNGSASANIGSAAMLVVICQMANFDNSSYGRSTQIIPVSYISEKRFFYHEVAGNGPYPFSLEISDSTLTIKREGTASAIYVIYGIGYL